MRTVVRVLMLVIAVAVLVYATLPWWLPAITIALLEREGAENVVLVVAHPDLNGFEIEQFEFELDGLHIGIADAELGYRPSSLLDGRLTLFRATRVFVRQLSSTDAGTPDEPNETGAGFAIPAPGLIWQYTPIDRIELDSVELQLEVPKLHVVGQFGLNAAEVSYRFVNIAPGDLDGLTLAGHIERVGVVSASATLPARSPARSSARSPATGSDSSKALATVVGRIDASGGAELTGSLNLADAEVKLLDRLVDVSTDTARLEVDFALKYVPEAVADPDDSPPGVTAEGSFAFDWTGDLPQHADLSSRGGFTYRADQWSAALGEATALTVGLSADPTFEVQLSNPADLILSYANDRLMVRGGLQLAVSEATIAGTIIGFEGGWLDLDPAIIESGNVSFEGRLSGIVRVDRRRIPGLFTFSGDFADQQVDGNVTLSAPGTPVHIPIRLSHNLDSATGKATAVGEVIINTPLIASILPGWGKSPDEVFDLLSGRLNLRGAADWRTDQDFEANATLNLGLVDLGGVAAEYPFGGATGTLALVYRNGAWQVRSDNLNIGELDVGFPVSDIGVSFSATEEILDVSALNASTLGGALRTQPFRYLFATGHTAFNLHISQLSLAEILALQGEDVTGSGSLSGIIPMSLANNSLSVTQGHLESAPGGGVIRYAGAAAVVAAAGQPGFDFALRALGDFNYQSLTADVDYAPDGTLSVAVSLVGNNPTVEDGRTIRYNLNVTQNLPDLLLSLRLSDDLSQGIQNKLNR
jgi:hypothetical protein